MKREQVIRELEFYYFCGESIMGLKSSFGDSLHALEFSGVKSSYAPEPDDFIAELDGRMNQIKKINRIHRKLQRLSTNSRRTLEHYFIERQFHPQLNKTFGVYKSLAKCTPTANSNCVGSTKFIENAIARNDKDQLTKIRNEAKAMFDLALNEYRNLK